MAKLHCQDWCRCAPRRSRSCRGEPMPSVRIELTAYGGKIAQEDLRKDLEKLVREDVDGLLFHTSPRADKRTLPSVVRKIASALSQRSTRCLRDCDRLRG